MDELKKTEEELANDSQIPAEMKDALNEKAKAVLSRINSLELAISKSIDDLACTSSENISICEIMAALMNVQRKMNQLELMTLIK